VSSTEIDLGWTAGTGADNYVVEQSTEGTNFTETDQIPTSETTYQDASASDGTTYYYEVYASNAVGNSGNSNTPKKKQRRRPRKKTGTAAYLQLPEIGWHRGMPRTARIAPGGIIYHVLTRGVGRSRLFRTCENYEAFQATASQKTDGCPRFPPVPPFPPPTASWQHAPPFRSRWPAPTPGNPQ
jgi:hypothetical protein